MPYTVEEIEALMKQKNIIDATDHWPRNTREKPPREL